MAYVEATQSFATDRHQVFQKGTVISADDPVVLRFPKFFREFVALPSEHQPVEMAAKGRRTRA